MKNCEILRVHPDLYWYPEGLCQRTAEQNVKNTRKRREKVRKTSHQKPPKIYKKSEKMLKKRRKKTIKHVEQNSSKCEKTKKKQKKSCNANAEKICKFEPFYACAPICIGIQRAWPQGV